MKTLSPPWRPCVVALATLVLAGCGSETTEPPPDGCPAASGPTEHEGQVTSNQVWTQANGPHVLTGSVTVTNGATLTIEPCTQVELWPGASIVVGNSLLGESGNLVAVGTADEPIRFRTVSGGDDWGFVRVQAPGTAEFEHVIFEDGGNNGVFFGASLIVEGDGLPPLKEVVAARHVEVRRSGGVGVLIDAWGSFTDDSDSVTVTGSGQRFPDEGYPMRLQAQALAGLPVGTYTGNAFDLIQVDGGEAISAGFTLRDPGVPFVVDGASSFGLTVARLAPTDPVPVLTLEAGVEIGFESGLRFEIGDNGQPGALVVNGTEADPVLLTARVTNLVPGSWAGLHFQEPPGTAANLVDHLVVEYAGGTCGAGCINLSCHSFVEGRPDNAAILFRGWRPATAFITNSTVRQSAGYGIDRGWSSDLAGPDFLPTNTFEAVAWCRQTLPRAAGGGCPGTVDCP